jgi:hypothetical protein
MGLKEWLRNQIAGLSIAVSNVEKNLLTQEEKSLTEGAGSNQEQRLQQGTLADSLVHGEITQEVKNLRWRTYKILKAMQNFSLKPVSENEDGVTYEMNSFSRERALSRIKLDDSDPFPLQMVFTNLDIFAGFSEAITNELISANEYFATNKTDKPLAIERDFFPKFYIENYTKKINIRTIDETNKLLEFYVSKYPDEYRKNSKLFIKEIEKLIENPMLPSNFLDMSKIGFITNCTLGVEDYLFYSYSDIKFDKIVEFDGHYIIKFKAKVETNGENILEKYVEPELDKKYENKEGKKTIYGGP